MTSSSSLWRLLEPGRFENPEKTRSAWMMHWVLLGTAVVLLPLFPLTPLLTDRPGPVWALHSALLATTLVALWLVRRGALRGVSLGFTSMAWIIITVGAALFGGIRAPAVLSYPVVVVAAGYLVGRRAAVVFAVLGALAALGFVWGDSAGVLPEVAVTQGRLWMGVAGSLAAVTLFVEVGVSANEQRRHYAEQLAMTLEAARVGTWELDPRSGAMRWGEGAERVFGIDSGRVTGTFDVYLGLVAEEDREAVHDAWRRARSGEAALAIDHRIVTKDGSARWVAVRGRPTERYDGSPVRLAGTVMDVTASRMNEEALRGSERRLAEAQRLASLASWEWDSASGTVVWSEQMYHLVGVPEDTRPSRAHLLEAFHPDDRGHVERLIERAERTGQPFEFERRLLHADGTVRHVVGRGEAVVDSDGRVRGLRGSIQDVTGRKRAESALRESEEKYRILFEHSPVGIGIADTEGHLLAFNSAMLEPGGYTREDIEQIETVADLYYDPADRESVFLALREQGAVRQHEVRFKRRRGGFYHGLMSTQPVLFNRHPALLSIVQDISSRKRVEAALQDREERLRQALAAAQAGAWHWDMQTNAVSWSEENFRLLGFEPDSMEPSYTRWLESVHPADRAAVQRDVEDAVAGRRDLDTDYRVQWPDGTVRWARDMGRIRYDGDGKPIAMYGIQIDVTDRKEVELRLRESEEQLRMVLSQIDEVVYAVDIDPAQPMVGTVTFVSDRTQQILGYTSEEFVRNPELWGQAVHPDDREAVAESTVRVLESGDGVTREYRLRQRDSGEYRWMEDRVVPQLDAEGRVTRMFGVARDVTERMETLTALRESEGRHRRLFETMAQGVVYQDAEGAIVDANPAAERILGLTLAEMQGRTSADPRWRSVHEDGSPFPADEHPSMVALRTGTAVRNVIMGVYHPKSEQHRWIDINAMPEFRMGEAEPYRAYTMFYDITARKDAEEALRASQERLHKAFGLSPDAIAITRAVDGRIVEINEAFTELSGYAREEAVGRTAADLGFWGDEGEREAWLNELRQSGRMRRVDRQVRDRLGVVHDAQLSTEFIELDGQRHILWYATDVTERKRAEEAVRRSREQLRQLAARLQAVREEERTAIAREIHDELGQALTGVKMDLTWLIGRFPKHWKAVRARGQVLTTLVDETIDVLRDLSSRLRPSVLDDLGLSAAVEWQAADFQRRVGSGVEIVAHVEEVEINRDGATALFRILQEALTNVIRHAQASRVVVDLRTNDQAMVLEVRDDGQGIVALDLEGTRSLGLIGMRERATALDGTLDIESGEGTGTIVRARLPLSRVGRGERSP
jgi:PAS domain S-box-containing protein